MAAASITRVFPLDLHLNKPVTSMLRLPRTPTRQRRMHQAFHIRGSAHRIELLLLDCPRALFQATAKDLCKVCNNEDRLEMQTETQKRIDLGRCALVSAVTAFSIQCGYNGDAAIATTYSPNVIRPTELILSVGNVNNCHASAPRIFNSSVMKNGRTGISHAMGSVVTDKSAKKSTGVVGLRKPALLVKRQGANLLRVKSSLRQVACSSAGACSLASISAVNFTNSLGLLSRLSSAMNSAVFRSSVGTSFNLLGLCTLVVWMQTSGQLPADTPVVLSQVAFRLFIPCFLMSKVATTLTSSSASNLIALPLMAVAQVIAGAVLGSVASKVFFRTTSQTAVNGPCNLARDGSPPTALTLQQQKLSRAVNTKKQALITAACAFGNSLTLPLVFLSGILGSSQDMNRAAGYLALYMVGWSPAMWSVGFKILTAGDDKEGSQSGGNEPVWQSIINWIGGVMNPPLYGVLVGLLIGGTPLCHFFIGGSDGLALGSTTVGFDTMGTFAKLRALTAGLLSPLLEAASLLGSATLAVQTVVLATSLGAALQKPRESSGTSLIEELSEKPLLASEGEIGATSYQGVLDTKAFWVISLVRLIMLPFTGILFSLVLQCYGMLPPDPVYRLVILAESAMPTAQNLVLLAQLNAGTRPLAGMLAQLLLRQYAISVIPITIWMTIFITLTRVAC